MYRQNKDIINPSMEYYLFDSHVIQTLHFRILRIHNTRKSRAKRLIIVNTRIFRV